METVFISTSMPGRARPDYFFALAESFSKSDYRVIIIIDGKPEILPSLGKIIFHKWPNKRPTKLKDFAFLTKLIKKYNPSILISSFGSVNIMNVCGYFFNVKNRINYVLSVSEPFYVEVTYAKTLHREFLKQRKKRIYSLATLLVCNTTGTKQDTIAYYNLHNNKYLVLHNLIEESLTKYKSQEERKNQMVIVGNLIKRKGHCFLLNQFKGILNYYPKMKLIIIGNGIEKNTLITQVKKLKISENVEFVGEVSNNNIASYFSNSLISISASIHEAFGFVNIEAMREGTPIISTSTVGAKEILKEKMNGEFFSLENTNSLTEAVNIILSNWESYSNFALESFSNSYLLGTQVDTHRELLKKKLL